MKKALLIVIAALIVSLVAGMHVVAAAPKPSVPEFTVKLINSSYVTSATNIIDPYLGQTVTHPSQRTEARTIEIRIKNVPFTPFELENGSNTYNAQFFYNIRFKGHFEEEWRDVYNPNVNGFLGRDFGAETLFSQQGEYSDTEGLEMTSQGMYTTFPPNAQMDFQVKAMIGYIHHVVAMPFSADVFEGESSDWSSTQTIIIPAASASPSASPTPTSTLLSSSSNSGSPAITSSPSATQQTQPEQPEASLLPYVLVTVAAVIIAFVAVVLVIKLWHKKSNAE
jgi:hypothetical protein